MCFVCFVAYITCLFWILHQLFLLSFTTLMCSGFISHVYFEFYINCVFWVLHHLCVPSAFEATVTSLSPAAIKTLPMGAAELLPWPFEIIWLLI